MRRDDSIFSVEVVCMMAFCTIGKGTALYTAHFESPLGAWRLAWCDRGLVCSSSRNDDFDCKGATASEAPGWLQREWEKFWLGSEVALTLCSFKEPSEFALAVYRVVSAIPAGSTSTYKDVALHVGNPKAARAVGAIMRANPWAPFVPCHRVIGSDGRMCGYGGPGGVGMKSEFLEYERSL